MNKIRFSFITSESSIPFVYREIMMVDENNKFRFIDSDIDYFLWIDLDQIFEPEHFKMLIDHDKDVISAAIMTNLGYFTCGTMKNNDLLFIEHFVYDKLYKVDFTGLGFLLIKKRVMEIIKPPYFMPENTKDIGDDINLCKRIKNNGFDIFVDPKCRVLHLKSRLI